MAIYNKNKLREIRENPNQYPWVIESVPFGSLRLPTLKPPTETLYKGGMILAFPDNSDTVIYWTFTLPENYLKGSDVGIHFHWVIPTSGAGVGAENAKADVTISWANGGDEFPAETAYSGTADVQNYVADVHQGMHIHGIDGKKKKGHSSLLCSVTRDTSVADNYGDDVYLLSTDLHYQITSSGTYFQDEGLSEKYRNQKGIELKELPEDRYRSGAW